MNIHCLQQLTANIVYTEYQYSLQGKDCIISTISLHCFSQLYFSAYRVLSCWHSCITFSPLSRMRLMASAQWFGSWESTIKDVLILPRASANPLFWLTRNGKPAESAFKAVKPKPSVLEGIKTRFEAHKSFFRNSRSSRYPLTISWLRSKPCSSNLSINQFSLSLDAPTMSVDNSYHPAWRLLEQRCHTL